MQESVSGDHGLSTSIGECIVMTVPATLERGRVSFERHAWGEAFVQLSAADKAKPLGPDDLRQLAFAAYLTGKDSDGIDTLVRAHHEYLGRGDAENASWCAFWLGMILMNKGERARGSGWFARAQRLIDERRLDCVGKGLLLIPVALRQLGEGDPKKAYNTFVQAAEIGNRFNDPDLKTLTRLGRGEAFISQGMSTEGITLLDEAMITIESDEVSPVVVGIVYCAVIDLCQKLYDLRRAQEWTSALNRWCESQPDLVPFRGTCLVRRAEIMQLHGDWANAQDEVQRACKLLSEPPGEPAAGAAFYQLGELYRLRGEFMNAEKAYRQAGKWGRKPQPGLALLRQAQGRIDTAKAAIRSSLDEVQGSMKRSGILPAYIEIMLAANDVKEARNASEELTNIATGCNTPLVQAYAAHATGAVLLAGDDIRAALEPLRRACSTFQNLETPYETARVRVLMGIAYRRLGDADTAGIEFDAARWIFEQLDARPDLKSVNMLARVRKIGGSFNLSLREVQVLRLIATGLTNKEIGGKLFISDRTVDRHVSNILIKLDVPSRAAATARAYKLQLL